MNFKKRSISPFYKLEEKCGTGHTSPALRSLGQPLTFVTEEKIEDAIGRSLALRDRSVSSFEVNNYFICTR